MQFTNKLSRFTTRLLPLATVAFFGGITLCASSANAQSVYRPSQADPFAKRRAVVVVTKRNPKTNKVVVVKPAPMPVAVPDVQARIDRYKAQKVSAMNAQTPAPKPVTAFLLDEVQVTGIFRTPRGYAAMVEATPIKLSYVIYPGEAFYDGQLVAVEESRLVFRRVTTFSDGKRDIKVEVKPLRKANAVTDGMTSRSGAPVAPPPPPPPSSTSSTTASVPSSLPE
ncbi:MAG: hypothetical protein MSG64_14065 [Pyrinomonadaceae bacterium MAG19_C2-C3]|nr:hypothetical protein [Pyrinomonadaceae bacterium MAG19_C2-C3]